METTGISPQTKRNLELLSKSSWLSQFYLAGGTACALYFGHRISYDLDFFTTQSFDATKIFKDLKKIGKVSAGTVADDTFLGVFDEVKISLFYYHYPNISEFANYHNIKIASPQDLVAMKIDALQSRGTKRDFIDLYTILTQKNYSLRQAIDFFQDKFKSANYNLEHVLMSIAYFDDAEKTPETLTLNKPIDWQQVKQFFIDQIKDFEKENLSWKRIHQ